MGKADWIKTATRKIRARGTEGVCTGKKFGGPSCRPGTKRYQLAKTFKKLGKKRAKSVTKGIRGAGNRTLSEPPGSRTPFRHPWDNGPIEPGNTDDLSKTKLGTGYDFTARGAEQTYALSEQSKANVAQAKGRSNIKLPNMGDYNYALAGGFAPDPGSHLAAAHRGRPEEKNYNKGPQLNPNLQPPSQMGFIGGRSGIVGRVAESTRQAAAGQGAATPPLQDTRTEEQKRADAAKYAQGSRAWTEESARQEEKRSDAQFAEAKRREEIRGLEDTLKHGLRDNKGNRIPLTPDQRSKYEADMKALNPYAPPPLAPTGPAPIDPAGNARRQAEREAAKNTKDWVYEAGHARLGSRAQTSSMEDIMRAGREHFTGNPGQRHWTEPGGAEAATESHRKHREIEQERLDDFLRHGYYQRQS